MSGLSEGEQHEIVVELTENPAGLDDGESQDKYDQLDCEHQAEVDDAISDYADEASVSRVGIPTRRGRNRLKPVARLAITSLG